MPLGLPPSNGLPQRLEFLEGLARVAREFSAPYDWLRPLRLANAVALALEYYNSARHENYMHCYCARCVFGDWTTFQLRHHAAKQLVALNIRSVSLPEGNGNIVPGIVSREYGIRRWERYPRCARRLRYTDDEASYVRRSTRELGDILSRVRDKYRKDKDAQGKGCCICDEIGPFTYCGECAFEMVTLPHAGIQLFQVLC